MRLNFKKFSWKMAFIVGTTVVIVGVLIAVYMEYRITSEINRYSELYLQYQLREAAEECDRTFLQAPAITAGMKNLAEARLSLAEYRSIGRMEDIVRGIKIYDTGFAVLAGDPGAFLETNELIKGLSADEKARLMAAGKSEVFEIKLKGVSYMAAQTGLLGGCNLTMLAPMSEVNAGTAASLIRFAVIFIVAFMLVIIISYFIGKSISAPLVTLSGIMRKAGKTGDITLSQEDVQNIDRLSLMKDEIGECIKETAGFLTHVTHISKGLEQVASGDLTSDVELLSDTDVMGKALRHMVNNLNHMFGEIYVSTAQVNTGSRQIADGSQALAQGSTEQAASVEQLSSSISEIADKTKTNAEMAGRAAILGTTIMQNAEKG
ncbi:MAG: methyl-accepting chemotaxis protein, partial [Oscillospiraceae bacterium]|nr:methyl-accepting chemotaxis protein [Oscillospiraceae bacterium]